MKQIAVFLSLLVSSPAFGAGRTGATFLKIPPTAASTILDAGIAHEDGSSVVMNPGATSWVKDKLLAATYSPYLAESQYSFLGYTHPTTLGNISASFVRLSMGKIEGRAADRSQTGSFTAEDDSFGIALSRKGLGANLKFIRQRIGQYEAQGFADDLGYHTGLRAKWPLILGLSVRNAGPKLRFVEEGYNLPTSVEGSLAYPVFQALHLALGVSREVHQNETHFSVGTQYAMAKLLCVRSGYALAAEKDSSRQPFPAFGLGMGLGRHSLDYAFMPHQDMGNVHKLSLTMRFR